VPAFLPKFIAIASHGVRSTTASKGGRSVFDASARPSNARQQHHWLRLLLGHPDRNQVGEEALRKPLTA